MSLKVDWCSYEAAKYAVEKWHYSHAMPASRHNLIGVWEDEQFIGSVVFSRGAVRYIGSPYGLSQFQCCELTRIALREHRAPVSQILAIAIRLLKKRSPTLRLIVSYADIARQHHGGIYQATNWIYVGMTPMKKEYFVYGKWVHMRTASSLVASVAGLPHRDSSQKHKYLYPLDDAIRAQILPLAKPYPKREPASVVEQ